ncbi:MAG: ATP-binding cassette domain-containing protein, partial [Gammaproteobacteria bacterium]|nr:ATP-binding cassette domain-containing protein [Gammaproteobacteria bacterium]
KMTDGLIEFDRVGFGYPGGVNVFREFSLTIPPGQRVGVVGHSGGGKSTLFKLILRFLDVQDGVIRIDGQDIREVSQDELRQVTSYVPQDPVLFHRSLMENIAYAKPSADKEAILTASRRAQAHDFIKRLPQGYDTLVGERGIKLSGGERQRVAIARALLKDAPILLLDEATSALDTMSEQLIQEQLENLMRGRTTLAIAHRISTIQQMDRIIVISGGAVVEDGSHGELIQHGKIYADLWSRQSQGFLVQ